MRLLCGEWITEEKYWWITYCSKHKHSRQPVMKTDDNFNPNHVEFRCFQCIPNKK